MIKESIEEAINTQANREFYSAYLYLSMAAYFESINLKGFANWMRVQFQEENFHAMKMFDYVIGRGGRAKLLPIEAPPTEWDSPLKVFEHTYEHEQKVTGLINNLVKLASSEEDYATYNMLQWYVTEQVEEESSASEILENLKMIGDDKNALLMLDREFAQRVFNPPVATE
ncbi:MAG: ferritin [Candidatus Helarchaeota archaeon]|nr:ferritin [Candidatus Helarchaeota archaeon]